MEPETTILHVSMHRHTSVGDNNAKLQQSSWDAFGVGIPGIQYCCASCEVLPCKGKHAITRDIASA
jgi:hypothetical protein